MSAQRLGSFLTNIEGSANQILRVKADESGFEMYTPASIPAYTITNDTADRIIDANNTNLDELSDVVATLIKDLQTALSAAGGFNGFQWSTSEQIYPFEKASDGSVLYCKEISLGALPNAGYKDVAHNITNLDVIKTVLISGRAYYSGSPNECLPLPFATAGSSSVCLYVQGSNIRLYAAVNMSIYTTSYARIIYAK